MPRCHGYVQVYYSRVILIFPVSKCVFSHLLLLFFSCVTMCHIELTEKIMIKDMEKHYLKHKKWSSPYCNEPVNTHDTAIWVHSVLWCAKNQNCTHTHDTHFRFTTGLPVPVFNPNSGHYEVYWGMSGTIPYILFR